MIMDKRPFLFKKFGLFHHNSTMRIGTDAVLLACWTDISDDDDILDIGTGCGIIPLMLAQKRDSRCPGVIDAVEIDEPSSIEANYNFKNSVFFGRETFCGAVLDLPYLCMYELCFLSYPV